MATITMKPFRDLWIDYNWLNRIKKNSLDQIGVLYHEDVMLIHQDYSYLF